MRRALFFYAPLIQDIVTFKDIYVNMFLRPFGSKRAKLERLCLQKTVRANYCKLKMHLRTIANEKVWIVRFFHVPLRHESDVDDTHTARDVPINNRCIDLHDAVCSNLAEQPSQGAVFAGAFR